MSSQNCVHELFFLLNQQTTTELFTLSLHDALPISSGLGSRCMLCWSLCEVRLTWLIASPICTGRRIVRVKRTSHKDRKSTRLNSSHVRISYAVFCLKKKNDGKMPP